MNKHLYIDFSHLCYRTLFATIDDIKEVGFGILRHSILKNVIFYIDKFGPHKVYIACDSSKNWRKKLYEPYKAQRAALKQKHEIDWSKFYETTEEISHGFQTAFPFYVIKVPYLEADDIIAHLVKTSDQSVENIIITSDSDYKQILQYPHTKVFDPIKKDYMKSDNPYFDLNVKILMGDKGDNIPSIAPRLGEKTAEKLLDGKAALKDQTLEQLLQNSVIKENYERNKKLIDLSRTPKDLTALIDKAIEEYTLSSTAGLYHYFVENGMKDLFSRIDDITKSLRHLNPGYVKPQPDMGIFNDFIDTEQPKSKYQMYMEKIGQPKN